MNILITGGAGFIGSYLARRLLDDGAEVQIFDNFSPQIHGGAGAVGVGVDPRARIVRADIRSKLELRSSLRDVEAVVHLAAETGTGQSMYEISHYTDVNVLGTADLLQMVAAGELPSLRKIVVASSRAIYGEGKYRCSVHGIVYPPTRAPEQLAKGIFEVQCPYCAEHVEALPTDESTPANALSIYGLTKYYQEQAVLMVARARGISAYALRYQNVYGPGQSLSNPYTGILAIFSNQARAGNPIFVFEDGKESRDFVYIEDVIEATARCLDLDNMGVEVLNVGTGQPISVMEVARSIAAYFGNRSEVQVNGAYRVGDIRHNFADSGRLQSVLGFTCKWQFEQGLKSFLSWVDGQKTEINSAASYKRSLDELRSRGLING